MASKRQRKHKLAGRTLKSKAHGPQVDALDLLLDKEDEEELALDGDGCAPAGAAARRARPPLPPRSPARRPGRPAAFELQPYAGRWRARLHTSVAP
jgi:hypothetical protein